MSHENRFETSRYLITELVDVVNDEYLHLLRDSQHTISVQGYKPPKPYSPPEIIGMELAAAGLVPGELDSIDVDLAFPSDDPYGTIAGYKINWKNGVNWSLQNTVGVGPIVYAGHRDRIIGEVTPCRIDDVEPFVRAAQLPYDEMVSGEAADIQKLLAIFLRTSEKLQISREKLIALNPYSALRVVQDGTFFNESGMDTPELVQELRLEVRHFTDYGKKFPAADILSIPTSYPVRAQHVVFHQSLDASCWEYYASYDGPIKAGELPGEYEESINTLTEPPVRLSILINEALQQVVY